MQTGRPVGRDSIATEPRLGLIGDVVDELRWTFSGRKGWLFGIGGNLVLALGYVGYNHYDPSHVDDIRIANIGVAVVVWVLSGVLSTNQLGSDGDRVRASLQRGDSVARILAIKNLALALMLGPFAIAISVIVRIPIERWRLLPHAMMMDVGAVFFWMGVGSVVSVLLPFRPISLRDRLKARHTWPRWAVCLAVPYAVFFLVVPVLHLPYFALYHNRALGPTSRTSSPTRASTWRLASATGSSACGWRHCMPGPPAHGSWQTSLEAADHLLTCVAAWMPASALLEGDASSFGVPGRRGHALVPQLALEDAPDRASGQFARNSM